jgi:DNA adenine methylase
VRKPRRPVLRYHGGKWRLAPWIISHFPPHRVYVEPFGGAASVLLRKERAYAEVYNDADGEIVNLFKVLRDFESASVLIDALRLTPYARDEFLQAYMPTEDPVERARRTVLKAAMGFGSAAVTQDSPTAAGGGFKAWVPTGFRANSNRAHTTPAHDWANYPDCLPAIISRLRGVVIENRPAVEVMAQHDGPDTLHYCDPPYVPETRSQRQWRYVRSYRHEMNEQDHRALAVFLREREGMVIVSGYPSELYDELYRGWRRIERDACASSALERKECLWLSPSISISQPALIEHKEEVA